MRFLFLILTCTFISNSARAEAMFDFGFAYAADSLANSATNTNTQSFYNLGMLFNLDRKSQWNMGLMVMGVNHAATISSVNTTFASLDFGPAFRWNIDKNEIFSVTAAYGYSAKGTYSSGSTNETWQGTSIFGQFSVQAPMVDGKFYMGMSLNYYSGTYPKKVVSSAESEFSGAKSWIFPMLSFTYRP